jgi:hypothetical protein
MLCSFLLLLLLFLGNFEKGIVGQLPSSNRLKCPPDPLLQIQLHRIHPDRRLNLIELTGHLILGQPLLNLQNLIIDLTIDFVLRRQKNIGEAFGFVDGGGFG